MWLTHGVDAHQALVAIHDVSRGKTRLCCPYCRGSLIAKKGRIKQPHFAHAEATCRAVARQSDLPTLPLYDQFHLQLSGKELADLHCYWYEYGVHGWSVPLPRDDHPLSLVHLESGRVDGWLGEPGTDRHIQSMPLHAGKQGFPYRHATLVRANDVEAYQ